MNRFFFFVTLANATNQTVKLSRLADNRREAFTAAVMAIYATGADPVSVQSASEGQFDAAISVPLLWTVQIVSQPVTEVLNPV